jgi:hypothetical protein
VHDVVTLRAHKMARMASLSIADCHNRFERIVHVKMHTCAYTQYIQTILAMCTDTYIHAYMHAYPQRSNAYIYKIQPRLIAHCSCCRCIQICLHACTHASIHEHKHVYTFI